MVLLQVFQSSIETLHIFLLDSLIPYICTNTCFTTFGGLGLQFMYGDYQHTFIFKERESGIYLLMVLIYSQEIPRVIRILFVGIEVIFSSHLFIVFCSKDYFF